MTRMCAASRSARPPGKYWGQALCAAGYVHAEAAAVWLQVVPGAVSQVAVALLEHSKQPSTPRCAPSLQHSIQSVSTSTISAL